MDDTRNRHWQKLAVLAMVLGIAVGAIVWFAHGAKAGAIAMVLIWVAFGGIETAIIMFCDRIRKRQTDLRQIDRKL